MNLAIFKDVTEAKELEERSRKSDTLHVVGSWRRASPTKSETR